MKIVQWFLSSSCIYTHMYMDGWMDGWMDGTMQGCICSWLQPYVTVITILVTLLFGVCWLWYTWYHCHSLVFQWFLYNSWQWGHYFLKTVLDNGCKLYLYYMKMHFMCTFYNCETLSTFITFWAMSLKTAV